jgi:hypothetical protein
MNRRQLDTVLAALRAWQRDMRDGAYVHPKFIDMACESSGPGGELDAGEIDDLCEELNCGGVSDA